MTHHDKKIRAGAIADKIEGKQPIDGNEMDLLVRGIRDNDDPNLTRIIIVCLRKLGNSCYAPLIVPHLNGGNVELASVAIKALCELGQGQQYKAYIIQAVDLGLDWDPTREVGYGALWAAGMHLKHHRDGDLAQLLIRWAPRDYSDPFYRSPPPWLPDWRVRSLSNAAGFGMGWALGADPEALIDDDELIAAGSKRLITERQDG